VKAYDPIAVREARIHFGDKIRYENDPYETVMNCDACLILTEWEQIKTIDLDQVKRLMKQPVVIDWRNCYDPAEMDSSGFVYASIGRPTVRNADRNLKFSKKQAGAIPSLFIEP